MTTWLEWRHAARSCLLLPCNIYSGSIAGRGTDNWNWHCLQLAALKHDPCSLTLDQRWMIMPNIHKMLMINLYLWAFGHIFRDEINDLYLTFRFKFKSKYIHSYWMPCDYMQRYLFCPEQYLKLLTYPAKPSVAVSFHIKNPWLWDTTTISHEIVLVRGFHEAEGFYITNIIFGDGPYTLNKHHNSQCRYFTENDIFVW